MYDPLVNLKLSQERQRRMREQASTDRLLAARGSWRHPLSRGVRALGRMLHVGNAVRRLRRLRRRQVTAQERAPKRAA